MLFLVLCVSAVFWAVSLLKFCFLIVFSIQASVGFFELTTLELRWLNALALNLSELQDNPPSAQFPQFAKRHLQ